MEQFDRQLATGIVIDFDTNQSVDNRTFLDVLKDGLVDFATQLGLNCGLYVAHPDNTEMPRKQGDLVAAVVRFKAGSNAAKTMKQAVEIVGNQKADKYIFLVTDCYNPKNKYHYEKGLLLNHSRRLGCKFVFLGVGTKYDKSGLDEFASEECKVVHLADTKEISKLMKEITNP